MNCVVCGSELAAQSPLCLTCGSPRGGKPAPLRARTVATLVDLTLVGGVSLIAAILIERYARTLLGNTLLTTAVLTLALGLVYHAKLESSLRAGTLGKQSVGLRVHTNGRPLSFVGALARYLAKIVSTISVAGLALALRDPERRTLHDRLAATRVIIDVRVEHRQRQEASEQAFGAQVVDVDLPEDESLSRASAGEAASMWGEQKIGIDIDGEMWERPGAVNAESVWQENRLGVNVDDDVWDGNVGLQVDAAEFWNDEVGEAPGIDIGGEIWSEISDGREPVSAEAFAALWEPGAETGGENPDGTAPQAAQLETPRSTRSDMHSAGNGIATSAHVDVPRDVEGQGEDDEHALLMRRRHQALFQALSERD